MSHWWFWLVSPCNNMIRTHYQGDRQGLPDEGNNYRQVPGGTVKFCLTLGNHSGEPCYNHSQEAEIVLDALPQQCFHCYQVLSVIKY